MPRRFFSSNSLFWVFVLLASVFVLWRNKPKSNVDLWTSSTQNYEIAVFTSPGKLGGTKWSVYNRPLKSNQNREWKYIMAMSSGEPIKTIKAWESGDGNRVLVSFPDCYIASNLKTGVLERAALVIGGEDDLEKIRTGLKISQALTFSNPRKLGPWLWQDWQWKGMLRNDPQIRF